MSALPPKADMHRHICACISPTDFMSTRPSTSEHGTAQVFGLSLTAIFFGPVDPERHFFLKRAGRHAPMPVNLRRVKARTEAPPKR